MCFCWPLQAASKLVDSWDEVNRQQAALALFQPGSRGMGAIEAELPLEPALASLSDGIQDTLSSIDTNMEDIEQQLELWKRHQDQHKQQQQQQRARAGTGMFSSPRPGMGMAMPSSAFKAGGLQARSSSASPWYAPKVMPSAAGKSPAAAPLSTAAGGGMSQQVELLYKVLQSQQDTEANLRARITGLRQQMEQLGIIKTDAEHQAGKTLGRWGDNLDSDGLDVEYGSEGNSDSEYEREFGSQAAAPKIGGRFSAAAAMRAPSATAGTALRGAPAASPLGRSAASRTPAGSSLSGMTGFATPAVSAGKGGSSGLHWVSPGATAAKTSSRFTPIGSVGAGSTGTRRQVTPGSASAGSSEAWRKLATELSNSTGQKSGSGRSKVRTTYATPASSRSTGRRALAPDRPSSPLQIPAAAAAAAAPAGGFAAVPSEPFSFNRASQSGAAGAGPSTPAAPKAAVSSKLSFSPAATPPAAASAAAGAASPALSPLWSTPQGAGSKAGAATSPLFQMQANPLFGTSPGATTPLAAVPAPALNMGAAAAAQKAAAPPAAADKPPAKPASKSAQPPEPPAALQQAAQSRVSCVVAVCCLPSALAGGDFSAEPV